MKAMNDFSSYCNNKIVESRSCIISRRRCRLLTAKHWLHKIRIPKLSSRFSSFTQAHFTEKELNMYGESTRRKANKLQSRSETISRQSCRLIIIPLHNLSTFQTSKCPKSKAEHIRPPYESWNLIFELLIYNYSFETAWTERYGVSNVTSCSTLAGDLDAFKRLETSRLELNRKIELHKLNFIKLLIMLDLFAVVVVFSLHFITIVEEDNNNLKLLKSRLNGARRFNDCNSNFSLLLTLCGKNRN